MIFVITLVGLGLWFFTPIPQLAATNGIITFLESHPTVQHRTGEVIKLVDAMKDLALEPQEQEFLNTWLKEAGWKKNLNLEIVKPEAMVQQVVELPAIVLKDFQGSLESSGLSMPSRQRLSEYALRISNGLLAVQPLDLLNDIFELLHTFLYYPMIIILGYGLIEGLLGASPGKIVLGITVATATGASGNVIVFLARFLLKYLAYGLVLAGLIFNLPFLVLSSLLVNLLWTLSTLGLLGGKRQTLYDALTGTSVFDSKED